MKIKVDEAKCIGCGTCVALCDKCFEMKGVIASPKDNGNCECDSCNLKEVAESCPVEAITVENEKEVEIQGAEK